jgi:hypothetical protein
MRRSAKATDGAEGIGLTSDSPKKTRPMSGPTLFPAKKREERRVFLEPIRWEELSEVAEFHSLVFKEMGADERVSRNDIIDAFLKWATESYWDDKGGKPVTASDRLEKAKRHAKKLAEQSKDKAPGK